MCLDEWFQKFQEIKIYSIFLSSKKKYNKNIWSAQTLLKKENLHHYHLYKIYGIFKHT